MRLANPFTVAEARQVGLTWKQLQKERWTRMSRGQYAASALAQTHEVILRAVEKRMPPGHAFSGLTAAWALGLDVLPCAPVEVTIAREVPVRARAGVRVRRATLPDSDIALRCGFRVTSPLRTVCDLGSRRDIVESVVLIDMALHMGLVKHADLQRYVDMNPGAKGISRLRRAVRLANERAESPMETRLRLMLVLGRLQMPSAQVDLHDTSGEFLGRADLYYPDRHLVIEYDGENHKDRLVADVRRQNALLNAGYHILRFTAADLRAPSSVISQVRGARARLKAAINVSPDYLPRRGAKPDHSPD